MRRPRDRFLFLGSRGSGTLSGWLLVDDAIAGGKPLLGRILVLACTFLMYNYFYTCIHIILNRLGLFYNMYEEKNFVEKLR